MTKLIYVSLSFVLASQFILEAKRLVGNGMGNMNGVKKREEEIHRRTGDWGTDIWTLCGQSG